MNPNKPFQRMSDKITNKHLDRAAYVYIRQSTLQQVRCIT